MKKKKKGICCSDVPVVLPTNVIYWLISISSWVPPSLHIIN